MTVQRSQVIQDAVEILTQLAASSREAEESVTSAAFTALCVNAGVSPSSKPRVAFKLHQSGLLEKASIDHREYRNCSLIVRPCRSSASGSIPGGRRD
jgi:hypothetical protein